MWLHLFVDGDAQFLSGAVKLVRALFLQLQVLLRFLR
jgi:hypothetical protein